MSQPRIEFRAPARLGDDTRDEVAPRILYCHCAYAKVVPKEVKREVLARLTATGVAFEAVADLCEMSARRDPALGRIASTRDMKIAACYPRAVRWLFHAAGSPLDADRTEVLNMREQSAADVVASLLGDNGGGAADVVPGGGGAADVRSEGEGSPEVTAADDVGDEPLDGARVQTDADEEVMQEEAS